MSNPPLARLVVACGLLSFLASAVVASPSAQTSRATSQQAAPDSDREWKEDPERLRRVWESCMSPEAYRRALQETGMLEALRQKSTEAATGWTSTGPFGDFGFAEHNGRVSGIQVVSDGQGGYKVYAGACAGGLWVTHSSSLGDWTPLGDTLENPSVRAFWVDENDHDTIVVGTGDEQRWRGGGVFRTIDGGAVWNPVSLPVTPDNFYRILPVPGQPGRLVAASSSGILVSTDAGVTWDPPKLTGHCTDLVIDPSSPQRMFTAMRGGGMYRSTNSGDTWSQLSDPDFPPLNEWGRASVAICQSSPNVVVVIVEHQFKTRGVYRTTTSGDGWDDITSNLLDWGGNQMFHAQAIAIPPNRPDAILAGAVGWAKYGFGGGTTWQPSGAPGHADVTQIYFSPWTGDDVAWVCNDGGIYQHDLSSDSTTSVNGGSQGLAISQIARHDADRQVRVGALQDNGIIRTTDGGALWQSFAGGDGGSVQIVDPEQAYFWFSYGVFPSPPAWRIRRRVSIINEDVAHPGDNSGPLVYDSRSDLMYSATTSQLVSRSQAGLPGSPWTVEVSNLQGGDYQLNRVFGCQADQDTVFVSYTGDDSGDLTICRRNGASWSVIHREGVSGAAILSVATTPLWKSEIWVTVRSGSASIPNILHSTDDGATWEDASVGLESLNAIYEVAVVPYNPRELYAASDIGVFRSTDGGKSWAPYQDGLAMAPCWQIQFVADDSLQGNNKLVLATFGRGTFERVIPGPSLIFVDKTATGTEDGTYEHPFDTVAEALAAASSGDVVMIRSNTYLEPQTTTKNVTLLTFEGTSVIR